MDKNDIEHLIRSAKKARELKKKEEQNTRSMDSWFKNSGKIEKTVAIGPFTYKHASPDRKKYGVFLNPTYITSEVRRTNYEEYLKTLEVDLTKYIDKYDKEDW